MYVHMSKHTVRITSLYTHRCFLSVRHMNPQCAFAVHVLAVYIYKLTFGCMRLKHILMDERTHLDIDNQGLSEMPFKMHEI